MNLLPGNAPADPTTPKDVKWKVGEAASQLPCDDLRGSVSAAIALPRPKPASHRKHLIFWGEVSSSEKSGLFHHTSGVIPCELSRDAPRSGSALGGPSCCGNMRFLEVTPW